jgi:hypothetical protein
VLANQAERDRTKISIALYICLIHAAGYSIRHSTGKDATSFALSLSEPGVSDQCEIHVRVRNTLYYLIFVIDSSNIYQKKIMLRRLRRINIFIFVL